MTQAYVRLESYFRRVAHAFDRDLPVPRWRWKLAQGIEGQFWELPSEWPAPLPEYVLQEQEKARFLLLEAERILGLCIADWMKGYLVVDIACGLASVVAEMAEPSRKFGIDPYPYPQWVATRYADLGMELVSMPAEDVSPDSFGSGVSPDQPLKIIMYNALQHVRDPRMALKAVSGLALDVEIVVVDYANVPADGAHPHTLSLRRINREGNEAGLSVVRSGVVTARLPGLVEYGNGKPAEILVAHLRRRHPSSIASSGLRGSN